MAVKKGSFCDVDIAPLSTLTNLQELTLYENENITGAFAIHLVGLPHFGIYRLERESPTTD